METTFFYALLSAVTEAWAWAKELKITYRQCALPSLAVHGIGAVVGLCILLAPARPYRGTEETFVRVYRSILISDLRYALKEYSTGHKELPVAASVTQAIDRLSTKLRPGLVLYVPQFSRFGAKKMVMLPIEWNTAVSGKPFTSISPDTWAFRYRGTRVTLITVDGRERVEPTP